MLVDTFSFQQGSVKTWRQRRSKVDRGSLQVEQNEMRSFGTGEITADLPATFE